MTNKTRQTMVSDGPPPFKRPKISECVTTKKNKVASAPKKAPAKSAKGKRTAGKLSKFPTLPLDIIFEIVSELRPLDLVHLSRVSKDFHALLHPSRNRVLWVAARKNIPGIPDCPSDLNECQYASLLFENRCQVCGSICKAESVDYTIRCRLCQQCRKELVRPASKSGLYYMRPSFPSQERMQILSLLPRSTQAANGSLYYTPVHENGLYHSYFVPELKKVCETWSQLQGDKEKLEKFVQERRSAAQELFETGREMQKWASSVSWEKRDQKVQVISKRTDEIKGRLKDLGYTEEDFPEVMRRDKLIHLSEWNGHLDQPKPLTARSWSILEPKLLVILNEVKAHRKVLRLQDNAALRLEELITVWPEFYARHMIDPAKKKLKLPLGICSSLPSVAGLIEEQEGETPITILRLAEHAENIIDDYTKALEEQQALMAKLVPRQSQENTSPSDLLNRASSLFTCNLCLNKYLMTFAQTLQHLHRGVDKWSHTLFTFQSDAKAITEGILERLGVPTTSSIDDVEAFEGRLSCCCGHPEFENKRMGLVELVRHTYKEDKFFRDIAANWGPDREHPIINDHDRTQLPSLIQTHASKQDDSTGHLPETASDATYAPLVCSICFGTVGRRVQLSSRAMQAYHLKAKHGLEWDERYVRKMHTPFETFPTSFLAWCSQEAQTLDAFNAAFEDSDYDTFSDDEDEGCVIA